jgi:hypothetical protein
MKRAARAEALQEDGTANLVLSLISSPWLFALVILGVNVIRLSLLTIILPSLIVPFAGMVAFAVWVLITGVTLVPAEATWWVALIPHSLTLVIELQAYILLLLGVLLLGKYWLRPQTIGAENRRRGYVRGLQHLAWLGIPAFVLLAARRSSRAPNLRCQRRSYSEGARALPRTSRYSDKIRDRTAAARRSVQ